MLNIMTLGSGALKDTTLSEDLKESEYPFLILLREKGMAREATMILLLRSQVSMKFQADTTTGLQTTVSHLQIQTTK